MSGILANFFLVLAFVRFEGFWRVREKSKQKGQWVRPVAPLQALILQDHTSALMAHKTVWRPEQSLAAAQFFVGNKAEHCSPHQQADPWPSSSTRRARREALADGVYYSHLLLAQSWGLGGAGSYGTEATASPAFHSEL